MELNRNKKLLLIAISVLLVSIISITSYAYFTASINSNAQASVITTGNMSLEFIDGNVIGLTENMIPGDYVEKNFTVKNIGDVETIYDLYLSEIVNDFADKNDLVYTLTSTNGCSSNIQKVVPSEVGEQSKITTCSINPNQEHEYTLTILFKDDGTNQDDNKGKRFSAVVSVNEYKDLLPNLKYVAIYNSRVDLYLDQTLPAEAELYDTFDEAYLVSANNAICDHLVYDLESENSSYQSCVENNSGDCNDYLESYNRYLAEYNECFNAQQFGFAVNMEGEIIKDIYVVFKYNGKLYILKDYENTNGDTVVTEESLKMFDYNKKVLDSGDFVCSMNQAGSVYECNIGDYFKVSVVNDGLVDISGYNWTEYLIGFTMNEQS